MEIMWGTSALAVENLLTVPTVQELALFVHVEGRSHLIGLLVVVFTHTNWISNLDKHV
jgi:hypothetical protein